MLCGIGSVVQTQTITMENLWQGKMAHKHGCFQLNLLFRFMNSHQKTIPFSQSFIRVKIVILHTLHSIVLPLLLFHTKTHTRVDWIG